MRILISILVFLPLAVHADVEPENMLPLPLDEEQPAVVEAPDRRSGCEQACDAIAAVCYEACIEAVAEVAESARRSSLATCLQPCATAQASCRARCD